MKLLCPALVFLVACSAKVPSQPRTPGLQTQSSNGGGQGTSSGGDQSSSGGNDGSSNGTGSPGSITDCGNSWSSKAVCDFTAGASTQLLIKADVVGPDTLWRGGEVLIDQQAGTVICGGCDCSAQAQGAATLECGQVLVSPGLINSHEHIGWADSAPYSYTSERFDDRDQWRLGLDNHTKIPEGESDYDTPALQMAEVRFMMGGATSLIGSGGTPHLLRNLDSNSQNEMEGLTGLPVQYQTFPLESDGEELVGSCAYKKPAGPKAGGGAWYPHVSEGVNASAENEFLCLAGAESGAMNWIDGNTTIIHAVALTLNDAQAVQSRGASVVWSPRSNIVLYGDTADVTLYQTLGINIALGTDWILSGSMNLLREFACVDEMNQAHYGGFFTDQQIVAMATLNGAKAAHLDNQIGSFEAGKIADLAMFSEATNSDYRAMISAQPQDVMMVMRAGVPLYGDADLLSALGATDATCETLAVCNAQKRLCMQQEVGQSLADVQAAAKMQYDLFYCGTPDNEPTCVPERNQAQDGSIYTGSDAPDVDSDGDGIPDASDNCPGVFNPPRPMDTDLQSELVQPDGDSDGLGDACDPCPFDNTNTCSNATFGGGMGSGAGAGSSGGSAGNSTGATPPPPLPGQLYLAELMPNPAGTDTDHEWVKIYNTGPADVDLSAVTLAWSSPTSNYGSTQALSGTLTAGDCILVGGPTSDASNASPNLTSAQTGFVAPLAVAFSGTGLLNPTSKNSDAVALFNGGASMTAAPIDLIVYEEIAAPATAAASPFIGPQGQLAPVGLYTGADPASGESFARTNASTWALLTTPTPNTCTPMTQ